MRAITLITILFISGCVTVESVKSLSDYQLCLEHSQPQDSETVWKLYDDELSMRESLDCKIYAKQMKEERQRAMERKRIAKERSEAMQEIADRFGEINDQQSGRASTNSDTEPTKTGFLKSDRTVISGLNKVCYYDVVGSIYTLNIKASGICPITYNF